MKKMLTLLGLGAFALAANAMRPVTPVVLSDYQVDPSMQVRMNEIDVQNRLEIANNVQREGVIKKTMTQGNNIWDIWIMSNDMRWSDILIRNDGQPMTFEELPFYWVSLYVVAENANSPQDGYVTAMNWPLLWPAQCAWDLSLYMSDADISTLDTSMTDLEDLANNSVNCRKFIYDGTGTRFSLNAAQDNIENWPVGLPSWFGTTTGTLEGQTYNIPQATVSGTSVTPTTATSTFQFKTYDPSEKYLEMDVTVQLLDNSQNTVRRIVPYAGTCRAAGFKPQYYGGKFGDIHIVNLGNWSSENVEDDPFDFDEWGPFQKYYMFAVSPDMQINDYSAEYSDDRFTIERSLLYSAADGVDEIKDEFLLFGMILNSKSGSDPADFNSIYKWVDPQETQSPWDPNATTLLWEWNDGGSVIPFGYNDETFPWSTRQWAMLTQVDGYNTLLAHPSEIRIGTTNGFELVGYDNYRNTYFRTYQGDITYHPNREKMSEIAKISAVGSLAPSKVESIQATEEAGIIAANGEIRIVANVDTEVAVYALSGAVVARENVKAGATVVVPVEKGIYVVKAGNGAKKVAL